MTVRELKTILNLYPDEHIIVLASDTEGNSYSPISSYCDGYYSPETTWCGSFYTDNDIEEDEIEIQDTDSPAILLWPIN